MTTAGQKTGPEIDSVGAEIGPEMGPISAPMRSIPGHPEQ